MKALFETQARGFKCFKVFSSYIRCFSFQVDEYGQLRKFSSCSTIYIDDSTVSQPNLKNTIKTVALAIYFHIRNRERAAGRNSHIDRHILDIFDEKLHPLSVSFTMDFSICFYVCLCIQFRFAS